MFAEIIAGTRPRGLPDLILSCSATGRPVSARSTSQLMKSPMKARGIATLVASALLVLLVATVAVGSSPKVCASCHGEVSAAMRSTAHEATGCYDCHAPGASVVAFKVREIFSMYPSALVGRSPSGPVEDTTRAACLGCHDGVLKRVTDGTSGLRIRHADCAPGATCDTCHSIVAHGDQVRWPREPIMEDCTRCHLAEDVTVECDTCHLGRQEKDRLVVGPWQVTHGPTWESSHGMGDLRSCAVCHPNDYCVRCHEVVIPHPADFGAEHGTISLESDSCTVCHKTRDFCDSCHGIEMPHPADYLRKHSSEAGTVDNPQCVRCHTVQDCERCHTRHVHPGGPNLYPGQPGRSGGDG